MRTFMKSCVFGNYVDSGPDRIRTENLKRGTLQIPYKIPRRNVQARQHVVGNSFIHCATNIHFLLPARQPSRCSGYTTEQKAVKFPVLLKATFPLRTDNTQKKPADHRVR